MNIGRLLRASLVVVTAVLIGAPSAHADPKLDRASLGEALDKLSASAAELGRVAKASDDRGARKKFGPAAVELGDDLAAASRRLGKDVGLKTVSKDVAALVKDANHLVELADEADDKDERKSFRAQATAISQGIVIVRQGLDSAAEGDGKPAARFTGRLLNSSDSCSWEENLKFVVSRNGTQVFTSGMVFPGKEQPLVLDKGTYLVQFFDTSGKHLGQATLDANHEGWAFKSGCVNQD